jgi:hypothetical protein
MLVRKNIYIEEESWNLLEILKDSRKNKDKNISISKLIQEAVEIKIQKEKQNNFLLKMKLCSRSATSEEEEEVAEILNGLSEEDLELTDEIDELDL